MGEGHHRDGSKRKEIQMPKAQLNTYHVTLYEVIVHTIDIKAANFVTAEKRADRAWRKDGPDAFSSFTLGRTSSGTTEMVKP